MPLRSACSQDRAYARKKRRYSDFESDSWREVVQTPNVSNGRNVFGDITVQTGSYAHLGDIHQNFYAISLTDEQQCHQCFKTSPYERYKDINRIRLDGTCSWVLDHPHFRTWLQNKQDALLWISADPGCGKSVLSRSLVDRDLKSEESRDSICYFFFKDNKEQNNTATAICALLHQLYTHQPKLIHHALGEYKANGQQLLVEPQKLWRIWRNSVADPSANPVICVLDALDECANSDRKELIELLCRIQHAEPHSTAVLPLKIVVTSRPYNHVERDFNPTVSQWPQIHLRGEEENDRINQEIDLVITEQVQDLVSEFSLSESASIQLLAQLVSKRNRTYLWLHLVMEEVREAYASSLYPDDVQVPLLPSSVEDAYERILEKVPSTQKSNTRCALSIILAAKRPLNVDEMACAFGAAHSYLYREEPIQPLNSRHLARQIRQWCGLFVFIQHEFVFLVHQTAKEFLLTTGFTSPNNPSAFGHSFVQDDIERLMARICTVYLSKEQPYFLCTKASSVSSQFLCKNMSDHSIKRQEHCSSFFQYCARNWITHAKNKHFCEDSELLEYALALFDKDSCLFALWHNMRSNDEYTLSDATYTQHIAAYCGYVEVFRKQHNRVAYDLEQCDRVGRTVLSIAAKYGHEELVRWLLQTGAGALSDALRNAASSGHDGTVRILLDAGAGELDESLEDAIVGAAMNGNETTVRLLLEARPNVEFDLEEALVEAVANDHPSVVRILLDAGAGGIAVALATAAECMGTLWLPDDVVQMLLDARPDELGNALCEAASKDYENAVQSLLDAGANPNAPNEDGEYALVAAVRTGNEEMVRTLLEAGADANVRGITGSPLRHAAIKGNCTVIKTLLDAGSDRF